MLPVRFKSKTTRHTDDQLSLLAWPAWRRVMAVLPALLVLWLLVVWALADVARL